jgi:hypothetical protein
MGMHHEALGLMTHAPGCSQVGFLATKVKFMHRRPEEGYVACAQCTMPRSLRVPVSGAFVYLCISWFAYQELQHRAVLFMCERNPSVECVCMCVNREVCDLPSA